MSGPVQNALRGFPRFLSQPRGCDQRSAFGQRNNRSRWAVLEWQLGALFLSILCAGCGGESGVTPQSLPPAVSATNTNSINPGMQASPLESTNILRSFHARGVIRDVPAGGQTLVIKHEEIPGFMAKMTMAFNVRDHRALEGLQPGDT
ncbi:MAG TPA: hypothetical protein DCE44_26390, partial [Verrucomicrobiales bacterium]|nr:hypothetical protein [Verrucomicrobiales bacterium]